MWPERETRLLPSTGAVIRLVCAVAVLKQNSVTAAVLVTVLDKNRIGMVRLGRRNAQHGAPVNEFPYKWI